MTNTLKRSSSIWVTFQQEGMHYYNGAPEGVGFLKHSHRHIFHFTAEVQVHHDDRDIEFILFKRELQGLYNNGVLEADNKSCEMLANDLIDIITNRYPNRWVKVTVSEDGENGATVFQEPVSFHANMKGQVM